MKKLFFALTLGLFSLSSAFAGNADLFSYDEQEVNASFEQLNQLEEVVLADDQATYASVAENHAELLKDVSENPMADDRRRRGGGNRALGIPSWIWGCALGIVGVAIVYFVTEDKDEAIKALWGLVAWFVVVAIVYIIAFASAANEFNNASGI